MDIFRGYLVTRGPLSEWKKIPTFCLFCLMNPSFEYIKAKILRLHLELLEKAATFKRLGIS